MLPHPEAQVVFPLVRTPSIFSITTRRLANLASQPLSAAAACLSHLSRLTEALVVLHRWVCRGCRFRPPGECRPISRCRRKEDFRHREAHHSRVGHSLHLEDRDSEGISTATGGSSYWCTKKYLSEERMKWRSKVGSSAVGVYGQCVK